MTPCEVTEVGPLLCEHCGNLHDYCVKLCDGREIYVQDHELKKLKPPADEKTETLEEELDHEHTA